METKEKQTGEHNVFDYANYGKDLEKNKPKPPSLSKENLGEAAKSKHEMDQKRDRDDKRVPRYALKPAGNLIEKTER